MNHDTSVERLVDAIRVECRAATAGSPLPTTREMAARYGVGPVTVSRALRRLSELGLVETRPGVGTFVRDERPRRPADHTWQTSAMGPAQGAGQSLTAILDSNPPGLVSLSSGYLDATLQARTLAAAAITRAARRGTGLGQVSNAGLVELREWFAADAGAGAMADDVVICAGTQAALGAVFTGICRPGDAVLMETPTYPGAIAAAHAAGLTVVPIHRGTSGAPAPDELDRVLSQSNARVFYAQPHWANPTGTQWPAAEHRHLVEVARRHGCFIIEDDWAADFPLGGSHRSLFESDDDGVVIRVRSITKSTVPALRVAAMVARGPVAQRLRSARTVADLYVSGVLQHAALDVLTSVGWTRHLKAVRATLAQRRDALVVAVGRHLGEASLATVPQGGMHMWVRLPDGVDDSALAVAALRAGVGILPGRSWWVSEPPAPHLRLCFAGADKADLVDGVEVLGGLIAEQTR